MASTTRSPFLDLPTELHLLIFDHCVPDGSITIGSQSRPRPDLASTSDHIRPADSRTIPGLPVGRIPVFRTGFHQELLQDADCGVEAKVEPEEPFEVTRQDTHRVFRSRKPTQAPTASSRSTKRRRVHAPETTVPSKRADGRSLSLPGNTQDLSQTYSAAAIKGVDYRWTDDKYCLPKQQDAMLRHHHQHPVASHDHLMNEESITDTVQNTMRASWKEPPYTYLPHQALHLTCRQFNRELKDHRNAERKKPYARKVDLYLSFPDGVCIAYHRHAHLLRIARTINITGVWGLRDIEDPQLVHPEDRGQNVDGRPPISKPSNDQICTSSLQIDQFNALELLTGLVLGKKPIKAATAKYEALHGVTKYQPVVEEPEKGVEYAPILNVRMWHPNASQHHPYRPAPPPLIDRFERARNAFASSATVSAPAWPYQGHLYDHEAASAPSNLDTYALIWSHTLSPVPAALQCVYGGSVKMAVARGKTGNAVSMSAKCNFANGRYLSMAWPKINDRGGVEREAVKEWLVPKDWQSEQLVDDKG